MPLLDEKYARLINILQAFGNAGLRRASAKVRGVRAASRCLEAEGKGILEAT